MFAHIYFMKKHDFCMKKQDFLFIFVLVIIFLPFFVSEPVYDWYKSFNAAHGMVMSFIKFGILATLGEMLGASYQCRSL